MKLEMHKNSLFAILLRSPWWISFVVAAALFGALRLVVPSLYASFFALPFVVTGGVAAWRQLRAPSRASIEKKLEVARAMDWKSFADALEAGFRRAGYEVARLDDEDADFQLTRAGRTTLVACKRWKVARTGVEPLRALKAAGRKRSASEYLYVAAGEVTEGAGAFAAEQGIRLVQGAELAALL